MDEDNEGGKEGRKLNSKKKKSNLVWFGLKCVYICFMYKKVFFFCVYEYELRIVCKYVSKAFFVCLFLCVWCMCMYEPFLLKKSI